MRNTITIPAKGETLTVNMTGKSVQVESMNVYTDYSEVPRLGFNPGRNEYPLYPGSTYNNDCVEFQSLVIHGTTESEDDQLVLISFDEYLDSNIFVQFKDVKLATLKDTFRLQASDAVQSLSTAQLLSPDGKLPSKMTIFVVGGATRGINFAFGANPAQGASNIDSFYWDNDYSHADYILQPLIIEGLKYIQEFNFIATVLGETPALVTQLEY